jgi:ketosteroid isomerase-like protein
MGTTEENRQTVRAAFEQWEQGDSRPFFALVADDVRWTVTGSTGISGTFHSKDAFVTQAAGLLTKRFAGPLAAKLVDVSADGDKVFVQWEGSAVSVTGLDYEQAYCWVLSMRDGRVVEALAYLDTELVSAVLK